MKELICIVCPKNCVLKIDEENGYAVTGNVCPRGPVYAVSELTDPRRSITSTVRITGADISLCPVRTSQPFPKPLIFEAMRQLNAITISAPVKMGDVVLSNVCGTGIDFIATKSM